MEFAVAVRVGTESLQHALAESEAEVQGQRWQPAVAFPRMGFAARPLPPLVAHDVLPPVWEDPFLSPSGLHPPTVPATRTSGVSTVLSSTATANADGSGLVDEDNNYRRSSIFVAQRQSHHHRELFEDSEFDDDEFFEDSWESSVWHQLEMWAPQEWLEALRGIRPLALGGNAELFSAQLSHNLGRLKAGAHVVLKDMEIDWFCAPERAEREIAVHQRFSGGPFVEFVSATETGGLLPGDHVFIMMEEADGTLEDIIKNKLDEVSLATRASLFAQVMTGVKTMIEEHFVHGDIKPDNVLIFGDCSRPDTCLARLGDFGLSYGLPGTGKPFELGWEKFFEIGPLSGVAPEAEVADGKVDDRTLAGPARDIWSAGLLLYQMLTGAVPEGYTEDAPDKERAQAFEVNEDERYAALRKAWQDGPRAKLLDLLALMLHRDPNQRIDASAAHRLAERIAKELRLSP